MLNLKLSTIALLILFTASLWANESNISNSDIRKMMIQQSISAYSGNCPCPYNAARNGSRCGKRSAWSRPGGYAPLCYPRDISDQQVKNYRKKMNLKK